MGAPRPATGPYGPRVAAPAIRAAAMRDLDEIVAIERAAFSDPWTRVAFAVALARPEVYFVVADEAGIAAGAQGAGDTISGYLLAWLLTGEGEIANVAVRADRGGRGIGALLLDAVLDAASRRDVGTMFLEVRQSNGRARALYASRGFLPVGRRRNYYRDPREDALILRRDVVPRGD